MNVIGGCVVDVHYTATCLMSFMLVNYILLM
jgi:hypothetical protein